MAINARVLGLIAAAVLLAGGAYAAVSALDAGDSSGAGEVGPSVLPRISVDRAELGRLPANGRVLVRAADTLAPRVDGQVYELSRSHGARRAGSLVCKQVHASPAGPGLCLALKRNGVSYEGIVFDASYRPRLRFPVRGVPDRVRVSHDGRYVGFTDFDWGSSAGYFANTSGFTVDTRIVDMRTGKTLLRLGGNLRVFRRGRRFRPSDAEFWGVTFGEGGRFYATMGNVFDHYLISGDVRSRRAQVVGKNIECPSLSPDGTRVAYKRRIPYTDRWRFHVLDLRSGHDVPLAEPRSIDDQPEWLDDDRVLYSDDRSVFYVPADGKGKPSRLASGASSPAVRAAGKR